MDTQTSFGQQLRAFRLAANLSVVQCADAAKISPSYWRHLERGSMTVSDPKKQEHYVSVIGTVKGIPRLSQRVEHRTTMENLAGRADFGSRLKLARMKAGLSATPCAKALGISGASWYHYEYNKNIPRDEAHEQIFFDAIEKAKTGVHADVATDKPPFSEQIRALRLEAGLSIRDAAHGFVHLNTWHKWERGLRHPSPNLARRAMNRLRAIIRGKQDTGSQHVIGRPRVTPEPTVINIPITRSDDGDFRSVIGDLTCLTKDELNVVKTIAGGYRTIRANISQNPGLVQLELALTRMSPSELEMVERIAGAISSGV